MNNHHIHILRKYIRSKKDGTIFITPDFPNTTDNDTIKQELAYLVQENNLQQILDDVYMKPQYNTFIEDYITPHPDDIADALARLNHWSISPCGNMALNLLGLSTQVPVVCAYMSDGPDEIIYTTNNMKLEFRHQPKRDITGMSYVTKLVVQALKELGENHITPEVIKKLANLPKDTKVTLLNETKMSTSWVRKTIDKIMEEGLCK